STSGSSASRTPKHGDIRSAFSPASSPTRSFTARVWRKRPRSRFGSDAVESPVTVSMLEPSSSALQLVGAVFNGRWRLTRLVGEGGMGAVYEAQGIRGEGVRAIKVLHPEFISEQQILDRFVAEAQAVRALNHPNVAQIFDNQRAEDGT